MPESFRSRWREIAGGFLKVGATAYGGPAIMGVMLALTLAYASLGVSPILRGALYGLGPVVLGIFVVAVFRLGTNVLRTGTHAVIAIAAAVAALLSPLGAAAILLARLKLMLAGSVFGVLRHRV